MKDEDTLLRMDLSLEREHQTTQIMSKDNASESEVKLFFFFPLFFLRISSRRRFRWPDNTRLQRENSHWKIGE